jgi:bifunctional non-homologous end joining protein LigD
MSKTLETVSLFFKEGTSDKEYHAQLVEEADGCVVNFQYGRRGSTLTTGSKTQSGPIEQAKAKKIFDKLVAEKTGKGYQPIADAGNTYTPAPSEKKATGLIPQLLNPIDEEEVERYLRDDDWGAQEKKDGRHQMLKKTAGVVIGANKKGFEISLPTSFVDGVAAFDTITLDGEAIGETYHVFDILRLKEHNVACEKYLKRHEVLQTISTVLGSAIKVVPLAIGYEAKKALYEELKAKKKEGVVFKRLSAIHKPGRPNSGGDMVKFKFFAELTARVASGREGKSSIGLELLDSAGVWNLVGNCTVSGKKPPVGSFVEIKYLYVAGIGGSLYQPSLKEVRDDVDQTDCTMTQIKYKSEEDD